MDALARVLVVDDDGFMRKLLSSLIRQQGFDVTLAEDAMEAMAVLRADDEIDLVISDWEMPGMTGVELCQQLRALNLPNYVHFMLLTARQQQADFVAAMEAGADDFLLKPLNPVILKARLEVVKRLLNLQQRLRRKNRLLTDAKEQLELAYAQLREDMEAAALAQRCLLPASYREMGSLRLASCLLPSAMVSGDMYNFMELADGSIAFYMVDVAGHGARAALLSVTLNHLLDAETFLPEGQQEPPSPDRIVTELNRRFSRSDNDTMDYFTMICGIVNPAGDRMTFCQAGHPRPVLIHPENGVVALGDGGLPVGLLSFGDYETVTVPLPPGARVLIYSDGMTECARENGEQFGEERLHMLLDRSRDEPIINLDAILQEALTEWRGGARFEDDISVLAFEVTSLNRGAL